MNEIVVVRILTIILIIISIITKRSASFVQEGVSCTTITSSCSSGRGRGVHNNNKTSITRRTSSSSSSATTNSAFATKMSRELFDAHNHIHLSLPHGIPSLQELHKLHVLPFEIPNRRDNNNHNNNIDNTEVEDSNSKHHNNNCIVHDDDTNTIYTSTYNSLVRVDIDILSQKIIKEFIVPEKENDDDDDHVEHNDDEEKDNHEERITNWNVNGVAIMSTQPRDFVIVQQLAHILTTTCTTNTSSSSSSLSTTTTTTKNNIHAIPCFGVHPWFLTQANQEFHDFLQSLQHSKHYTTTLTQDSYYLQFVQDLIKYNKHDQKNSNSDDNNNHDYNLIPSWLPYLYHTIQANKSCHIGEIGLDNARFDPITKDIVCPIHTQLVAFETQLHLAAHLHKSVSIHSVRCWGVFIDSLRKVKKERQLMKKDWKNKKSKNDSSSLFHVLPPCIYMHAFGGNASIVDQINSICSKDMNSSSSSSSSLSCHVYYGFAPVINFRSPKTAQTIQKVGIHNLVLESDLEDYTGVVDDLKENVLFVANVLGIEPKDVIKKTTENARRLYTIHT